VIPRQTTAAGSGSAAFARMTAGAPGLRGERVGLDGQQELIGSGSDRVKPVLIASAVW
jgi:hypothetical protein